MWLSLGDPWSHRKHVRAILVQVLKVWVQIPSSPVEPPGWVRSYTPLCGSSFGISSQGTRKGALRSLFHLVGFTGRIGAVNMRTSPWFGNNGF